MQAVSDHTLFRFWGANTMENIREIYRQKRPALMQRVYRKAFRDAVEGVEKVEAIHIFGILYKVLSFHNFDVGESSSAGNRMPLKSIGML
jgi:hypothetical protein